MMTHESHPCPSYRVGILGATGLVGQQFIRLLEGHSWFKITRVGSSDRWKGCPYAETREWIFDTPMPQEVASLPVVTCEPVHFLGYCDFVFSAMDASVADAVELSFSEAGLPVFSNTKCHRRDPLVPILLPYVNPDHLNLVTQQPSFNTSGGFIVTNANCSTTGLCVVLGPLYSAFPELNDIFVATLQAISGAGIAGPPPVSILSNAMPFIDGEEEKLEYEPRKILGFIAKSSKGIMSLQEAPLTISAACHRIDVTDGHLLTVSFKINTSGTEDVQRVLQSFKVSDEVSKLPSCPPSPLVFNPTINRPQPKIDRNEGKGMSVVVGSLRPCSLNTVKLTLVVHNTILGAAGGSILNAELAVVRGLIHRRQ